MTRFRHVWQVSLNRPVGQSGPPSYWQLLVGCDNQLLDKKIFKSGADADHHLVSFDVGKRIGPSQFCPQLGVCFQNHPVTQVSIVTQPLKQRVNRAFNLDQ
tara:strand:- start:869 stop:1171 length:303 start_codon:yes stop_codon:yes gene_type:complete